MGEWKRDLDKDEEMCRFTVDMEGEGYRVASTLLQYIPRVRELEAEVQRLLAAAAKSSPLPMAADPSPVVDLLVVVNIEGGLVDKVKMPPGIRVIVRDYDVEGADEDEIVEDEDGNECVETERFADGSMR